MSDGVLAQLAAELRQLELKRRDGVLTESETSRRQDLLDQLIRRIRKYSGIDRRKQLRIPAGLEVRFRMAGATITCAASELSYGGLGLRGHLWIIEDQELVVENLRLSNRDYPMAVKARVVWKISSEDARPGAGLCFVDMDEAGRRQIRSVFESLFLSYLERLSDGLTSDG